MKPNFPTNANNIRNSIAGVHAGPNLGPVVDKSFRKEMVSAATTWLTSTTTETTIPASVWSFQTNLWRRPVNSLSHFRDRPVVLVVLIFLFGVYPLMAQVTASISGRIE